jgi:hypothetical protein
MDHACRIGLPVSSSDVAVVARLAALLRAYMYDQTCRADAADPSYATVTVILGDYWASIELAGLTSPSRTIWLLQ